jgi:hypothetical protein
MSTEMRSFLQLIYSFCRQYIVWYEQNIKAKYNCSQKQDAANVSNIG